MSLIFKTADEEETIRLGERLGAVLSSGSVVLLDGDLGAGKTHFSKGVARGLGTTAELTSPTFNLVLEYLLPAPEKGNSASQQPGGSYTQKPRLLRHFDLYRLEDAEQLDDLDYFGLIEQDDAVSLVEWGGKFSHHLPLDYLHISITMTEAGSEHRTLDFSATGAHSSGILERFAAREKAFLRGESVHDGESISVEVNASGEERFRDEEHVRDEKCAHGEECARGEEAASREESSYDEERASGEEHARGEELFRDE